MRRAAVLVLVGFLGASAFAAEPAPAKVLAVKADVAKADAAKVDAAKVDAAKVDAAKVDAAKVDPDAVVPDAPLKPDADPTRPAVDPVPPEELSLGWTLLRTVVVLGIVILTVYITLNFGLRRLMGIASVPRGQAVVQVVERIPLDQKRAMFVIKAAGEYLLIGGGDGALQLIAKLDSNEVEKLQQTRPPSVALSPFLQKLLKRRDVPAPPAPGDNS